MLSNAKKALHAAFAFVLATALCVPSMAFGLDGQGDTSSAADGSMKVYVQDDSGHKALLKSYSADEFTAMAEDVDAGYQYSRGGTINIVSVKKMVTLDKLFSDAGASEYWTEGASLTYNCTDGVYTKFEPTYEQYAQDGYFYPNRSNSDTANVENAIKVPTGIAIPGWYKSVATSGENSSDALATALASLDGTIGGDNKAGDSTKLGVGIMKDVTTKDAAADAVIDAGWRLTGGIIEVTINAAKGVVVDDTVLEVQLNGQIAKKYSASDLKAFMTDDTIAYNMAGGKNRVYAATGFVTFDALFADAGVSSSWVEGSKLQFICTDGVYKKGSHTYADYQRDIYYYPNLTSSDLKATNGAVTVPAVIAYTYGQAEVGDGLASDAAANALSNAKAHDYGCVLRGASVNSDGEVSAAGNRFPSGVVAINIQTAASKVFSDVAAGSWYEDAVTYAFQNKLMTGYTGTDKFGVGDTMSRAQFATVLWRDAEPEAAAAYQNDAKNTTGFGDVADNQWYTAAVNWAVEQKLMGQGTESFGVNDPLTREMMCTVLARSNNAEDGQDTAKLDGMPDKDSVDPWAANSVAWALNNGVISGVQHDDGSLTIDPLSDLTRETYAKVLYNMQ